MQNFGNCFPSQGGGWGTCSFQAEVRDCSQALELTTFQLRNVTRLLSETVCCLSMIKVSPHTLCRHMVGEGMNGGTASLILNLSTRLMWVFIFTLTAALPSGNAPPPPPPCAHWIGGRVGLSSSLDCLQKRKISCPCRKSNHNPK
jgi:hypothetical protein